MKTAVTERGGKIKKMILWTGLNVCVFFLFAPQLMAKTYYVRTDGNDENNGWSNAPQSAWQTINHAIEKVKPGDTVEIQEGNYPGGIIINTRGEEKFPTIFRGMGKVVINTPGKTGEYKFCIKVTGDYNIIKGFEISSGGYWDSSVYLGGTHNTVCNNVIHDSGRGICLFQGDNNNLINNTFYNNRMAVSVEHSSDPGYAENNVIARNIFYDNTTAVSIARAKETQILGNIIYGSKENGIVLSQNECGNPKFLTTGTLIEHNIIAKNKGSGIVQEDKISITSLDYNDTWGNEKGNYSGIEPGGTDISTDPFFMSPGEKKFTLRDDSPCYQEEIYPTPKTFKNRVEKWGFLGAYLDEEFEFKNLTVDVSSGKEGIDLLLKADLIFGQVPGGKGVIKAELISPETGRIFTEKQNVSLAKTGTLLEMTMHLPFLTYDEYQLILYFFDETGRELSRNSQIIPLSIASLDKLYGRAVPEYEFVLGKDDRTGQPVTIKLGRKLPAILTTKEELNRWRESVFGKQTRRGAVYSWNHPTAGPVVMAKKGDPSAMARVYAVEGPLARSGSETAFTGNKLSPERIQEISGYPKLVAEHLGKLAEQLNRENYQSKNCWGRSSFILEVIKTYELIYDSGAISPELERKIKDGLDQWLSFILAEDMMIPFNKPYPSYVHNMGSAYYPGAWAIATLLQDENASRKLFELFKIFLGAGVMESGFYHEGEGYATMAASDLRGVCEIVQRNGGDLSNVACRARPLMEDFRQPKGFRTFSDFLFFDYRLETPDLKRPVIHDGCLSPYPSDISTGGARAGYGLTGEERYASFARWLEFDRRQGDPNEIWALLPDYPKESTPVLNRLPEIGEPDGGIFVFRDGTGFDTMGQYILLLNTPKAGWHSHNAFGHFSIFRWNKWLTSDVESSAKNTGYQPLRDQLSAMAWAHNTVVINGEGWFYHDLGKAHHCRLQNPDTRVKAVDLELENAHHKIKVSHRRQFVVLPECILIVDNLVSEKPVSFDWWVHGEKKGAAAFTGKTSPAESSFPGYSEKGIINFQRKAMINAKETFSMDLPVEKEPMGIKYTLLYPEKLELYLGEGVSPRHGGEGVYPNELTPYAVLKHPVSSKATFIILAEPYREKSLISSARIINQSGVKWQIKITLIDGTTRIVTADGKDFTVNSGKML